MDRIEIAVIGGGVIGLAIARALAQAGREVLVLEAAAACGSGASSRNSEVIHAGLYYPPGSLKARFCVEGRLRLYELCARRGIPHRRCGKLIVADSAAQLPALEKIAATAHSNGVELQALDGPAAAALEPQLTCRAALYSPHTGILDSHAYLLALLGEAEASGATCACSSRVTHMALEDGGVTIAVNGDPPSLLATLVVNAAGLDAPALARATDGFPREHIPQSFRAKGSYFALAGRASFSRLIYPVPEPGGLGIHLTLDLAGRARFGPDVQWLDAPETTSPAVDSQAIDSQAIDSLGAAASEPQAAPSDSSDYAVDPRRAELFYPAIRRYWPALPDASLHPAYAGIRAKITGPGSPAADFRIDAPDVHGAPMVNLFGIESPGLTASLAIAEHVSNLLQRM